MAVNCGEVAGEIAEGPAASLPPIDAGNHVIGRSKRILTASLTANSFVLLALYNGVLGVLLPNQIAAIDPSRKSSNLAMLLAVTSVFSTIATPLSGALSDRTRCSWGRRSPWIVFGALVGSLALISVSMMTTLGAITVLWVIAAVAYNSMQAPMTTVIADRFPQNSRGVASGFVGAGMTAGGTVGFIVAGRFASNLVLSYAIFSLAIVGGCVVFVLVNRESSSATLAVNRFQWSTFLKSFWISPKENPDFAWAFLGRFTIYMGYQAVTAYLFYILLDYIHLSTEGANIEIGKISSISFLFLSVSCLLAGMLSDRLRRRKPFVFFASLVMGSAMVVPLFIPTVRGMYYYAALMGLGYGTFMSIDLALMTQVLPDSNADSHGKDLGILTAAINIPQILSPIFAVIVLRLFHYDYRILFMYAIVFLILGSLCVIPIKSTK
jgi:MFS family permease